MGNKIIEMRNLRKQSCVLVGLLLVLLGAAGCGESSGKAQKDEFLTTFLQKEIARMNKEKVGAVKMVQTGDEVESGRLDSIDWASEMDGLLEFSLTRLSDTTKYGHWKEEGKNKMGMPLVIERYFAKDTMAHLQSVEMMWEGMLGDVVGRKMQIQVVEWQFKQQSWWMDRKVKAYYQPTKAIGYEIQENSIWSSPKEISVQITLDNPLYLDNR